MFAKIVSVGRRLDQKLFDLASKHSVLFLQLSIGLIYLWFGLLKFFPGYSPAEGLATETLRIVSFGLLEDAVLIYVLASWELFIGVCMLLRIKTKFIIWVLLLHMAGTLSPLVLLPHQTFAQPPLGFSLVGQYIMKNLVIIGAAFVIYSKRAK